MLERALIDAAIRYYRVSITYRIVPDINYARNSTAVGTYRELASANGKVSTRECASAVQLEPAVSLVMFSRLSLSRATM